MTRFFAEREAAVNAVTDELGRGLRASRQVMDRTFHVVEKKVAPTLSTRRAQIAAGAILGAVVGIGAAILVYRRRRRRTLASRIQRVLPEQLVRARAVKRALG